MPMPLRLHNKICLVTTMTYSLVCLLVMLCTSCTTNRSLAPVTELKNYPSVASGEYRVQSGDTLYSIAWLAGLDYRQLAAMNRLPSPYTIRAGQILKIKRSKVDNIASKSVASKQTAHVRYVTSWPSKHSVAVKRWYQPVKRGRLLAKFSAALGRNPGIDITAHYGEPIHAASAGTVVYSGTGVRGYGNLIIIKHNASYLSAYAHNKVNLVHQGEKVKANQRIALMGQDNSGRSMLHFEIRRNGVPVDPLRYL